MLYADISLRRYINQIGESGLSGTVTLEEERVYFLTEVLGGAAEGTVTITTLAGERYTKSVRAGERIVYHDPLPCGQRIEISGLSEYSAFWIKD